MKNEPNSTETQPKVETSREAWLRRKAREAKLPPDFDATKPLKNKRHEAMLQLVFNENISWTSAYEATVDSTKKCPTRNTCRAGGSQVGRMPTVKARLAFLAEQQAVQVATGRSPEAPLLELPDDLPTEDHLLRVLAAIVQQGGADSTTLNAAEKLLKRLESRSESEMEFTPEVVFSHMIQLAGWSGEQICKELGGTKFMVSRICDLCKITPAELAGAASALATT